MKKVAIITRTKDRPAFLKRAVNSVSTQTVKDYVHVIVNDGGNEKEVEAVLADASENVQEKIKVFHRKTPSGAPDTIFNESIDRVDSTYVVIHDDDDTWHPEFLEKTLAVLEAGANGVVVRTDRIYETIETNEIKNIATKPYLADMQAVSLYRQCRENQLTPISFIYSRKIYEKIGKYDSSLPVAGDWEFGLRFLLETEVKFLDPGFALANYHKRINTRDDSYANQDLERIIDIVANKHLRQEIKEDRLGVGYIISRLANDRRNQHNIVRKLIPVSIRNWIRAHTN